MYFLDTKVQLWFRLPRPQIRIVIAQFAAVACAVPAPVAKNPGEARMSAEDLWGTVYARERGELPEQELALLREARLRASLTSILAHWDEFGPEFGFDEVIHHARLTLKESN